MNNKISTILVFLLVSVSVFGAWLDNVPQTLTQPNGEIIHLFATGDEYHNWLHDENNYTIIQDPENGYYVYARLINDELLPTSLRALKSDPASAGLIPGLNISGEKYRLLRKTRFQVPDYKGASQRTNTGTLNNIVIFIRFQYQSEYAESFSYYDNSFNGNSMVSMNSYFGEVSANQLDISTGLFPSPSGDVIVSYQDAQPRNYYMPYNSVTNPSGYQGDSQRTSREHTLLKNAVNHVKSQIEATGRDFDMDNDGYVDNVCFIIQGQTAGWSDLLWPHMWVLYTESVYIGSARVWTFNFQLSEAFGVSVLCHEMFHSLGAPDLYRYEDRAIDPVGTWDLMNWNRNPPQHMTVHMKQKYGGWTNTIPTITNSGTYTLAPLSDDPFAAYKIPSPNSNTEFFVVEYRRAVGQFESSLPGSGLIIYRVDPSIEGNAEGPPDELYVYRPGGSRTVNGDLNSAYFSSSSARTRFDDTTDPSAFLSNGAPGGIRIQNISDAGSTISFDLVTNDVFNPPTNLTASVSGNNVGLNWQKPATGSGTLTAYKVFRSGTLIQTITNPNTLSYTDNGLSAGTYTYHLKASYSNPAGESASSNQVNVTIGAQGSPDLTITNASVTPQSINPGGSIDLFCHLENSGDAMAGESMLRIYFSTDQSLSNDDRHFANGSMGEINPGYYIEVTGTNLTTPADLAQGTWYLLYVADADSDVSESNENNNIAAVAIQIGNTFIAPTNLAASVTGNNVNLSWTAPSGSSATLAGFRVYRNQTLIQTIQNPATLSFVDNGLSPGTYSYQVSASYTNPTGESDPSNTATVTVSEQALPDFVILDPLVIPVEVEAGQNIDLSCKYLNNGEAVAGASTLGIYVSQNTTLDDGDVLFAYGEFDPLDPGYYYEVTGSEIALPDDLTTGTWYVIFAADIENEVNESSETNNTAYAQITVIGAPLNPPVNLTASVTNQNVALSWNSPAQTQAVLSGYSIFRNNSLVGQSNAQTTAWTDQQVNPGTYTYYVIANYSNPSGQSGPSNTVNVTIEEPGKADLTITNASADPTTVSPGGLVSIACRLNNTGEVSAGESWLRLYISADNSLDNTDTEIANGQMSSLDPGYYISVTGDDLSIPSGLANGRYYILFVADADNNVDESNENNNLAAVDIMVGTYDLNPPLDLRATVTGTTVDLNWSPPAATSATRSAYRIYRNNSLVATLSSGTLTYTDAGLAYGTYSYHATAVYTNPAGESEPGNEVVITLSSNAKPDLIISDALVNPGTVDPGADIYIYCKMSNIGNGKAGSSTMRIYLSKDDQYDQLDKNLAYGTLEELEAGQYMTVQGEDIVIPTQTEPGNWYILFVADADKQVEESNEENNLASYPLVVAGQRPDLLISDLLTIPSSINAGGQMRVTTMITNGGLGITDVCELYYYVSDNQILDQNDTYLTKATVKKLLSNEKYTLTNYVQIPASTGSGTKYLIAKIDGAEIVAESNEENNLYAAEIYISATGVDVSDLFSSINIYPNPASDRIWLNLQTEKPERMMVEVYSSSGQKILAEELFTNRETVRSWDVRSWPRGLYLIKLGNGKEQFSKQIILQ